MKNITLRKFLLATGLFLFSSMMAQAPQKINYQAVARDASGNPIASKNINVRFTIHEGSATGTVVYSESQVLATNAFGVFSTAIGSGTVISGTMGSIVWGTGDKYLQVEFDPSGGNTFSDMGASQLLSVPFALYSANGTPGPQGPAGAQGAAGAQGPAGSANISGTTNSLVKFSAANTGVNSMVTDNGTTVGINQSSPSSLAALDVNGSIRITGGGVGKGKVLQTDSVGLASWQDVANPKIAFSARFASSPAIPNNSVRNLHFLVEDYDDGSTFSDSIFTCPASGVYHFDVMCNWSAYSSATGFNDLIVFINGVFFSESILPNNSTTYVTNKLSVTLKLNQGDVLTFAVFQSSGASQNMQFLGSNRVMGYRLY